MVLLAVTLPDPATASSDTRAGPTAEALLGVVAPVPSADVEAGPITFTWRRAGPGTSYAFTLQQADGRVVWSSTATDTVAILPDSVTFTPGLTWFWSVDALLPDGRSRSTGMKQLSTRP
ncbi:MAG: hypothetical protein ACREMH_05375 [Gemmatimonadales bacterium]